MATEQNDGGEFLKSEDHFRDRALRIIGEMDKLTKEIQNISQKDTSVLLDEILHSIFFLGKINTPPFSPESILGGDSLLEDLKSRHPQPFQLYSSKLPRRSPFSCVLDMMVHLVGQENEEEVRRRLQQFINEVEGGVRSKHLISSTICISQKSDDSVRHYGVSMSTSGPNPGKIMVAASCLSAWDDYVAGAVMTYYPNKFKKPYFDGTIKIPDYVRCQAFSLTPDSKSVSNGGKMNPCRSCGNLFGLNTVETEVWAYGNCAEAESLSNLLKIETKVKKQSQLTSDMWTPENIEKAREDVLKELKNVLNMIHFKWDGDYYTPQSSIA